MEISSGLLPGKRLPLRRPLEEKTVDCMDSKIINGIEPSLAKRLKVARVPTSAQLASLPPQELSQILGWWVERVRQVDLIGQARRLARKNCSSS